MKNVFFALSLLAVLILALLLVEKDREGAGAHSFAVTVARQRGDVASQAAQNEKTIRRLRSELRAAHAAASSPAENPFQRDPQLRAALENEATEGIEKNVQRLLASGMTNRLHLDAAQNQALAALLTNKANLFFRQLLLPMMTGDIQPAEMPAAGLALRQAFDDNTSQLRALLGEDGFATYQWFEKTQSSRDDFEQFRAATPLSDGQSTQLLAAMEDTRANFKMRFEPDDPSQLNLDDWYDNFSDAKLQAMGDDLEQLNDLTLQRAQNILDADQSAALKEFLTKQLLRGAFVARSTTAMFANNR